MCHLRRQRKLVASLGWLLLKLLGCRFCNVSTSQHIIDIVAELTHSCEDEGLSIAFVPSSILLLPQREERDKALSPLTDTAFPFSQDDYFTMTGDMEPQTTAIKEVADMALPTLDGPSPTDVAKGKRGEGVPGRWY